MARSRSAAPGSFCDTCSSFGNAAVYRSVPAVDVTVFLVRVMEPPTPLDLLDFRYSPTWPRLAERFKWGCEVHLPDRTHFLPMEDPALTASYILADE
jgi:lipase